MGEPDDETLRMIRMAVWSGFTGPDAAADMAEDFLLDEPDLDGDVLRVRIAAAFARKAEAERTWRDTTDCDRLDAAFAALPDDRILALHDAGFTMADRHLEAAEALDAAPQDRFAGYCFYHRQDVEGALEGGDLWIAFDHVRGAGPEKAGIGHAVAAALRAAGLDPVWDGDPERRIALRGFTWQRRLTD